MLPIQYGATSPSPAPDVTPCCQWDIVSLACIGMHGSRFFQVEIDSDVILRLCRGSSTKLSNLVYTVVVVISEVDENDKGPAFRQNDQYT